MPFRSLTSRQLPPTSCVPSTASPQWAPRTNGRQRRENPSTFSYAAPIPDNHSRQTITLRRVSAWAKHCGLTFSSLPRLNVEKLLPIKRLSGGILADRSLHTFQRLKIDNWATRLKLVRKFGGHMAQAPAFFLPPIAHYDASEQDAAYLEIAEKCGRTVPAQRVYSITFRHDSDYWMRYSWRETNREQNSTNWTGR